MELYQNVHQHVLNLGKNMSSNCECLPLPSGECSATNPPSGSCDSIRMFFGYSTSSTNIIPGKLDILYYTPPTDQSSITNGFVISNYSAKPLFDSGVLNSDFSFSLRETELLSTGSFEGWISYIADDVITGSPGNPSFGSMCATNLGINIAEFKTRALRMYTSLKNGDGSSFFSPIYNSIITNIASLIYENPDYNYCESIKEGITIERLVSCYNWIKNIADTYYGKQFLVKISGDATNFPGVCIKDETGNTISLSNLPIYIEGDASSQGYYTSDEITDGGFPKQCSTNVLGLTKLDWVQNTDGKIASFVKIGQISSDTDYCSGLLQNRFIYKKFTDHSGKCVSWTIDLSKLDPNNYYIDIKEGKAYLYLKCDIENRFYIDDSGIWVNINLAEKVPLTSADIGPMLAIRNFHYLLSTFAKEIIYKFLDQQKNTGGQRLAGARSSTTQLNLGTALPPCLIPEGAVIPLKSNVYRYGPYYHVTDPDDGGGIDVIIEENLAPWNFIKPNDTTFPSDYPYCAMDKFGKELAQLTTKGLQKLEKGRVTVVGLPCYNIGSGLNTIGYDLNKEVGPTLLTDISVEYGSGGFNTTYNFSTYSPRLGKSEKYLRDAWTQNLERTQFINNYLRSEREKNNNIKKEFTKQLLDKNYFFTPLSKHKSSTPNRIMFSGYYLSDKSYDINVQPIDTYTTINSNMPDDAQCSPTGSTPTSTVDIPTEPTPYGSGIRRYVFSETDKGYTIEYAQKSYFQLAGMSLDGFYLPVSLRGVNSDPTIKETDTAWTNQARLPRFAMRCKIVSMGGGSSSIEFVEWDSDTSSSVYSYPGQPIVSKTRDEIPPFSFIQDSGTSGCYSLPINQKYLNPYVSKFILDNHWNDNRKNESDSGFVISSIVFGQDFTDYQISHTCESDVNDGIGFSSQYTDEYVRQTYNNFRFPAMRGPLVLQGWGYDTSGKPIPNASDTYINAEYGQFRKDGLTDKFLKNWLQNPKTWPVGPIDLRFDRERGVWTCPSPNKILIAELKENLCPFKKAKAKLLNPTCEGIRFYETYNISGPQGENIKLSMDRTEIVIYDFIGESIRACTKVYVYYDDNRYIVLKAVLPPALITAKAFETFTPLSTHGIKIKVPTAAVNFYATDAVFDSVVYDDIENPMGYGAMVDDWVTVQRVLSENQDNCTMDLPTDNSYKYIVIGTGSPPGPLKS